MGWNIAGPKMHSRDPAIISRQEARQHVGQKVPGLHIKAPHDAKIICNDITVSCYLDIALMQICVEKPSDPQAGFSFGEGMHIIRKIS